MSGQPAPLPLGRQRVLAVSQALTDLDAELALLRDALPLANDAALRPALDQLGAFAGTAGTVLQARGDAVDQRLVDALADLLGTLRLVRLPARDPELGFTLGLREVRGAQGQIALTLTNALAAAAEIGLRPTQPPAADALAAEVPRALFDDRLDEIAAQLDAVAERLDALDAARQAADAASPEAGLVAFYLGAMRVEVNLARLSLRLGETTIDFAALARATGAMGDLTGDFLATLRAWAARVSSAIRHAAEGVRAPVRLIVTRLRGAAQAAARRAIGDPKPAPPEPPPAETAPPDTDTPPGAFSPQAVRDLILAGRDVPAEWVPLVTQLDFSGTDLTDLTPLTRLTALQQLTLGRTYAEGKERKAAPVTDVTPLAGLTALQWLDLDGTQVSDVTPLAGLTALQWLYLSRTQVSDVTPLAGLTALQWLYLSGTQVSDVTPLAGLTALQELYLTGTQVRDVSALQQPHLTILGGPSSGLAGRAGSVLRRLLGGGKRA